jgi:hypothetical protein
MNDQYSSEEKETIEALQSIQDVPERPQAQIERGKAAFLAEAEAISSQPVSISPFQRLINSMTQPKPQLRLSTLTIAIIFAAVLLISFSGSVVAARRALPEQPLYPYKLWLEDQRLALTSSKDAQIDLHLDYAEERLREYQALERDSSDPVSTQILDDFYHHTTDVNQLISSSSRFDEQQARLQELQNLLDQLIGEEGNDQAEDSEHIEVEDGESKQQEEELSPTKATPTPLKNDSSEEIEDLEAESTQKAEETDKASDTEKSEQPEETEKPNESEEPDDDPTPQETDEPDDSSDDSEDHEDEVDDEDSPEETPED